MKPHALRKTLSIANGGLAIVLLGVAWWFFSEVLPATAEVAHRPLGQRSHDLRSLEQAYEVQRQTGLQWVPGAPVSQADIHAYILRSDYARKDPEHWIFSGPMPPPDDARSEPVRAATPGPLRLESQGHVALLVHGLPGRALMLFTFSGGAGTGAGASGVFRAGDWVRIDESAEQTLRLTRIDWVGGRRYEIHYDIFGSDKARPIDRGVLFHSAGHDGPWPPFLAVVDTVDASKGEDSYAGALGGEPGGEPAGGSGHGPTGGEGDAQGVGGTAADAATPSVVATPRSGGVSALGDLRPLVEVNPRNRSERAVRFDRNTYEFFRGPKAKHVAASIKTEVAVDRDTGRRLGLRITGLKQGSAAGALQVKKGDILVSINGHPISSRADVVQLIERLREEKLVTVVLERRGKQLTYHVDPRDPQTRRQAFVFDNLK